MSRDRIFITGAGGFIGSALTDRLVREGHEVHVLLRPGGRYQRLSGIRNQLVVHEGTVNRADLLNNIVKRVQPERIFHLAATGLQGHDNTDSIRETNILGTMNLLRSTESVSYRSLIHVGSGIEYGHHETAIPEGTPARPAGEYATSKAAATMLALAEAQRGKPVTVVRIFQAYGPGELQHRLVPSCFLAMMRGQQPEIAHPEYLRDFVYIDDIVELLIRASECEAARGAILHAATGNETCLADVVKLMKSIAGYEQPAIAPDTESVRQPGRNPGPVHYCGSVSRTTQLTGWKPRTDLRQGLEQTWNWLQNLPDDRTNHEESARNRRTYHATGRVALGWRAGNVADNTGMLSLIVPVFNEEEVLESTARTLNQLLESLHRPYEVIIVDNGSIDQTPEIAATICQQDRHWKYIRLSRNFGYQNSITAGMLASVGDAVMVIDVDLQDPPELIPVFLKHWESGYDVVYGIRERRIGESWLRIWPTMLAMRLITWMSDDIKLPAHSGDFRLISARVREALRQLPETNRYTRGIIHWLGFRQIGVPYTRRGRVLGTSKVNWRYLIDFTFNAIVNWSVRPLRIFSLGGAAILGICCILGILGLSGAISFGLIETLLLFNAGFLSCGIGVLGEYIAKIHHESKRRPLWLVDYTINLNIPDEHHPGTVTGSKAPANRNRKKVRSRPRSGNPN
jgi:polyisoprenyl-phosphate glycosyltransferase